MEEDPAKKCGCHENAFLQKKIVKTKGLFTDFLWRRVTQSHPSQHIFF
jgi:hypothetical protein